MQIDLSIDTIVKLIELAEEEKHLREEEDNEEVLSCISYKMEVGK